MRRDHQGGGEGVSLLPEPTERIHFLATAIRSTALCVAVDGNSRFRVLLDVSRPHGFKRAELHASPEGSASPWHISGAQWNETQLLADGLRNKLRGLSVARA